MAPTLTSNTFLPKTIPNQRIKTSPQPHSIKNNAPFFPISAKQATEEAQKKPQNSTPFQFAVKSLVPIIANPSPGLSFINQRRKDTSTVFVAGAMGQVGVRIAQILLRKGFSVRAGVTDLVAAQELARVGAKYKIISNEESKRLNAVDSTFQDVESIAKSIGNASKVVVAVGPEENGPSSEVTNADALKVIRAAKVANVDHVAIVYDDSSSSSSLPSTNNVIDGFTSFFNSLFAKEQPLTIEEFLQKVVETEVSYTLIKANLTEDYGPESSYNLIVSNEGSSEENAYKVTKTQIASLVADVFSNSEVAENKVIEVCTDPSAPTNSIYDLLSAIPEDGRREAYAEALEKAQAEEDALQSSENKRIAAEEEEQVEDETKEAFFENILDRAKGINSQISWEKLSTQFKTAIEKAREEEEEEEPNVQVSTVEKETERETRKIFGGLFKQETIYVDED